VGKVRAVVGWAVIALPIVGLSYPIEARVAPAVRVRVLDEHGAAAANAIVQQDWGFHTVAHRSLETKRTDGEGYVSFPARSVWRPWVVWVVGLPLGVLTHSGWGEHAGLHAYGSDPYVWTSQNCGVSFAPPTELRLERRRVALFPE
jgi:hypothetical protein